MDQLRHGNGEDLFNLRGRIVSDSNVITGGATTVVVEGTWSSESPRGSSGDGFKIQVGSVLGENLVELLERVVRVEWGFQG
ncbi:hypothetical protein PanWU01x14_352950 [Parasponia andersonii]|uniref:Uncharacterized protein n=1 Tax=Parasponia andersonii TaxID=3476 RepID=A0A2P5AA58_PARAD|nr:hypothetical protein PanWU01x14_352950 [Parasponia andersonii]